MNEQFFKDNLKLIRENVSYKNEVLKRLVQMSLIYIENGSNVSFKNCLFSKISSIIILQLE